MAQKCKQAQLNQVNQWSDTNKPGTHYINKKVAKRYNLRCLKKAGLKKEQLTRVYVSLIRSVCEYTCQVWGAPITQEENDISVSILRRSLRVIKPYVSALEQLGLPSLKIRRLDLCEVFQGYGKTTHTN